MNRHLVRVIHFSFSLRVLASVVGALTYGAFVVASLGLGPYPTAQANQRAFKLQTTCGVIPPGTGNDTHL